LQFWCRYRPDLVGKSTLPRCQILESCLPVYSRCFDDAFCAGNQLPARVSARLVPRHPRNANELSLDYCVRRARNPPIPPQTWAVVGSRGRPKIGPHRQPKSPNKQRFSCVGRTW
jgi:hypothetical protein